MRRGRWLLSVSTALVGVALALVGNLATNTVQVKAGWVPLVWVATGVLVVAAVALQAGSEPERGSWPTTADAAVRDMRETVDVQWRDEAVRILSLANSGPMPVRWSLTAQVELTDRSGQVELAGTADWEGTADDIDALVQRFKRLSPRRLVIVGGPGAGKTTLAVQLLRRLLAGRKKGEPVPVLLSVSGWDIAEHPTFKGWLTAQLEETYPSLREPAPYHARRMFELGHLLPILDGLDELSEEVRPRVLRLINEELDETSQVMLTSRTREYAEAAGAGQLINRAAVIEAAPLSPDAAADHLGDQLRRSLPHPGWRLLIDELRAGRTGPLAEVLASPLGLWLLRSSYDPTDPDMDPSVLLDRRRFDTAQTLRSHLFDRLIPELVRLRRPASGDDAAQFRPERSYQAADVEQWLSQLADVLRQSPAERRVGRLSTGSRDFAWWSLAGRVLPYPLPAPAFLLAAVLAGCAWITLIGRLALGLGVLDSIVLAVVLLLLTREGKYTGYWTEHRPAPAIRRLSRRIGQLPAVVLRALPFGLFVCVVMGVVYTAYELFWSGLTGALRLGLRSGLLAGLVLVLTHLCDGLARWTEAPTGEAPASTPFASWRADRAAHITRLLIGAALAGATGGVAIAAGGGALWQIALGTGLGLLAGAMYALVSGNRNAWPAYLMATVRLTRRDLLPRTLMPFLHDAHKLGLLRAVGPVYQFRHADFQDHLAARHLPAARPAPTPVAPVPTPPRPPERLTPELVGTFKVPRRLLDAAWSPDGRTVALFRDGSTRLVDLSGRRLRVVRHGLAPLRLLIDAGSVAFSPDGRLCAITGGTIRLWPLGRMVGHARIFEVGTGREVLKLRHPGWVQSLAFSPDCTRLATGGTGGDDNTLRIWDTTTGEQLLVINHTGDIGGVAFSPDGLRLVTGTYILWEDFADDATTEVWDTATGEALLRLRIDPVKFHNIKSVAFSPDGRLLAAANGWAVTIWDALTGAQVLTLPVGAEHVEFSPDHVHFLTSGSGPHTDLRRISDGESLLRITHQDWVARALFSPDARLLLSVGEDRTAQLWRLWPDDS